MFLWNQGVDDIGRNADCRIDACRTLQLKVSVNKNPSSFFSNKLLSVMTHFLSNITLKPSRRCTVFSRNKTEKYISTWHVVPCNQLPHNHINNFHPLFAAPLIWSAESESTLQRLKSFVYIWVTHHQLLVSPPRLMISLRKSSIVTIRRMMCCV